MGAPAAEQADLARFVTFTRDEWRPLRAATPLSLSEDDLTDLRGINDRLSLDEVADVYLPLSRLLNLYVSAAQSLHKATDTFLGTLAAKVPYVIGIAGSVAVGKSTTARVMQALLRRWPDHPAVDLVTTDGFLHPNEILEARGIMNRKGFPESYDVRRLVQFLADVKSGRPEVRAPVYSHVQYDIVPGQHQIVSQPDIVIVEGLNVLQTGLGGGSAVSGTTAGLSKLFVSDFFDFSIYVDADERDIEQWYVERFLTLWETIFQADDSYFHRFAGLSKDEAVSTARTIWDSINGLNLKENILPTKGRANLILEKGADHAVRAVHLRKL